LTTARRPRGDGGLLVRVPRGNELLKIDFSTGKRRKVKRLAMDELRRIERGGL